MAFWKKPSVDTYIAQTRPLHSTKTILAPCQECHGLTRVRVHVESVQAWSRVPKFLALAYYKLLSLLAPARADVPVCRYCLPKFLRNNGTPIDLVIAMMKQVKNIKE